MNNRFLINYTPGSTFLHKLNGTTKVIGFIAITVAIIATFDFRVMLAIFLLCMAGVASMKPNWKPIVFMFGFLIVMNGIIGSLMVIAISPESGLTKTGMETVFWSTANGKFYLSWELLWYSWAMFFKRVASLSSAMLFVLSITPSELAAGLNSIKMPYKVCTIVSLAFRTIPDIARDFTDIKNSMMMRGVELEKASLGKKLKQYIIMLVPLLMSSFAKVENISNSMDLRSYGKCKGRTWFSEHPATKGDRIARVVIAILFAWCLFYIVFFRNIHAPAVDFWCPWVPKDISGYWF